MAQERKISVNEKIKLQCYNSLVLSMSYITQVTVLSVSEFFRYTNLEIRIL